MDGAGQTPRPAEPTDSLSSASSISRGAIFSPPRLIKLFEPASDRQTTLAVPRCPWSPVRNQPRAKCGGVGGSGIVPHVAGRDIGAAEWPLHRCGRWCSVLPASSRIAIRGLGGQAPRAGLARARGGRRIAGHLMRRFGHTVRLNDRHAERRFQSRHDRRRQRGGRGADEPQRTVAPAGRAGACARARTAWCIVGTAEYQVGRQLFEPVEKFFGVKLARVQTALPPERRAMPTRRRPAREYETAA